MPLLRLATSAVTEEELQQLEAELETLAGGLDGDVRVGSLLGAYAVALGRRGCSLWAGVRFLARELHLTAAAATLRPALEALILIGWLAADPDDRLVRWHGESERSVRAMFNKSRQDPDEERAMRLVGRVPEERIADRNAAVAAARERAGRGERLMPSVETMAGEARGGPTFWEAYAYAYRLLSAWEHHDHATFDEELVGPGVLAIEDATFDQLQIRALGASITAALLIVVGVVANLPIVDKAQEIRSRLLAPASGGPSDGAA